MPLPESVFAEIEEDRASRERELRLVENVITKTDDAAEQEMLRRSLVLLTYAHLEGFCKFALSSYANAINGLRIPCKDASIPLVALTLRNIFSALRDQNSKHKEFQKLENDRDLHLLARERRFIERFEAISATKVEIPDHVVDTKSNLSALILKRNLYQLGLPYPIVDTKGGSIDRLRNTRNAIAHGDRLKRPNSKEVSDYISTAFDVMKFVQQEVLSALNDKVYQRNTAADLNPPFENPTVWKRALDLMREFRHL